MENTLRKLLTLSSPVLIAITLGACGVANPIDSPLAGVPASNSNISTATPSSAPASNASTLMTSCHSSDPSIQCIGLKIVSYQNGANPPVLSKTDALTLVQGMNTVWGQCKIAFQLEKFELVDPVTRGLAFSPNWRSDSTQIRSAFQESNEFLVVAVGPWSTATIAVTQMPGYGPFGTLVDQQYAKNPLTVGHELGHYMGLYHYSSSSNLMNPYIGPNTKQLTQSQCDTARSTNLHNWMPMFR